jgi:epoxyqueuosine reductase
MNLQQIQEHFLTMFDSVGIVSTKDYLESCKLHQKSVPNVEYPTLVVVGLHYPKRIIPSTNTYLLPSFYTFGSDYHLVLRKRMSEVMSKIPYDYIALVDNHPHDERIAASLSGIGFFGKNQLIIHPRYGSYQFLGMLFINIPFTQPLRSINTDSCGDCHICIDACPPKALSEQGYNLDRCISNFNQSKQVLSDSQIKQNHLLFGCDICQLVCPKNPKVSLHVHPEFNLSGKEQVAIEDLFTLSAREFERTYSNMAYLWKGKTILMRNALTLLLRQKNVSYNTMIETSLQQDYPLWYKKTATSILSLLQEIANQ